MPDTTTLTHDTLGNLFEDIADAIREKNPSAPVEDSMVADTFPTEIRAIPSGGEDFTGVLFEYEIPSTANAAPTFKKVKIAGLSTLPNSIFGQNRFITENTTFELDTDIQNLGSSAFTDVGYSIQLSQIVNTYGMKACLEFISSISETITAGTGAFVANYFNIASNYTAIPDDKKVDFVYRSKYQIGTAAFQNNPFIKSVEFTNPNFNKIDNDGFAGCCYIENITLNEGLTHICNRAFECYNATDTSFRNNALTSVDFPSTLQQIQSRAFRGCNALTTVRFFGKPTYGVDNTAFKDCPNLTDIYVPWSNGEVSGAPWGATSAIIHYDWTPTP